MNDGTRLQRYLHFVAFAGRRPITLEELMRPVLPNHFIVEVRLPTGWTAQVDRRLASLERDFGDLKQDVKSMKQYVGRLKGMSRGITFRQKASSYLSAFLKGSQDASKWAVPFVGGEEWEVKS